MLGSAFSRNVQIHTSLQHQGIPPLLPQVVNPIGPRINQNHTRNMSVKLGKATANPAGVQTFKLSNVQIRNVQTRHLPKKLQQGIEDLPSLKLSRKLMGSQLEKRPAFNRFASEKSLKELPGATPTSKVLSPKVIQTKKLSMNKQASWNKLPFGQTIGQETLKAELGRKSMPSGELPPARGNQRAQTMKLRPNTVINPARPSLKRNNYYERKTTETPGAAQMINLDQRTDEGSIEDRRSSIQKLHRQPTKNISKFTQDANVIFAETIQEVSQLKKYEDEQLKLVDKVDCAGMLKKANMEMKVLNQILDRLIPSDDSHTVIDDKRKLDIEVIPDNLMTFKVPAKGFMSPLKIYISYKNEEDIDGRAERKPKAGGETNNTTAEISTLTSPRGADKKKKKFDLRAYVSQDEKVPTEKMCDRMYNQPLTIMVHAANKQTKIFEDPYVYVSFYSYSGCSISCRAKFTLNTKNKRKKIDHDERESYDFLSDKKVDPLWKHVLRLQKQEEQQKLKTNHVKKNKRRIVSLVVGENLAEKTFKEKLENDKLKDMDVKVRRQLIEDAARQKKLYDLIKWDLFRQQRDEELAAQRAQQITDKRANQWNKMIQIQSVFRAMWRVYLKAKKKADDLKKMNFIASLMQQIGRRWLFRFGPTLEKRLNVNVKFSLNFAAQTKQEKYDLMARKMIKSFLFKTDIIWQMIGCVRETVDGVIHIQRKFRAHCEALQSREIALKDVFFSTETPVLINYFKNRKKGVAKHNKVYVRKLLLLPTQQKIIDRICKLYMVRQKFYYTIRFLWWIVTYRSDGYTKEEIQDNMNQIEARAKMLYEIDQRLWLDHDFPHVTLYAPTKKKGSPRKRSKKTNEDLQVQNSMGSTLTGLAGMTKQPSARQKSERSVIDTQRSKAATSKDFALNSQRSANVPKNLNIKEVANVIPDKLEWNSLERISLQLCMAVSNLDVKQMGENLRRQDTGQVDIKQLRKTISSTTDAKSMNMSDYYGQIGRAFRIKVPGQNFSYLIFIGMKIPNFSYLPQGKEIIHRLIMRAAHASSERDFDLELCNF